MFHVVSACPWLSPVFFFARLFFHRYFKGRRVWCTEALDARFLLLNACLLTSINRQHLRTDIFIRFLWVYEDFTRASHRILHTSIFLTQLQWHGCICPLMYTCGRFMQYCQKLHDNRFLHKHLYCCDVLICSVAIRSSVLLQYAHLFCCNTLICSAAMRSSVLLQYTCRTQIVNTRNAYQLPLLATIHNSYRIIHARKKKSQTRDKRLNLLVENIGKNITCRHDTNIHIHI
jgi:hypothetical protein